MFSVTLIIFVRLHRIWVKKWPGGMVPDTDMDTDGVGVEGKVAGVEEAGAAGDGVVHGLVEDPSATYRPGRDPAGT